MTRGALLSLNKVHLQLSNLDTVDSNAPPPAAPPSTRWFLLMMDLFGEDQHELLEASIDLDSETVFSDRPDTVCDLLRSVTGFLVAEANRADARIELSAAATPHYDKTFVGVLEELLLQVTSCAMQLRRSTTEARWQKTLPAAAADWQRARELEKARIMRSSLLGTPACHPDAFELEERHRLLARMLVQSKTPDTPPILTRAETRIEVREPVPAPGFDRALMVFHRAARSVPAYRAFLAEHEIDAQRIRTPRDFTAVPPITKANYLDRYSFEERLREGARSTGDVRWLRASLDSSAALFDTWFGPAITSWTKKKNILVIVSFNMGNWLEGTSTKPASEVRDTSWHGHHVSVLTPGLNPVSVLADIAELGPKYDQVVLAGYPPFVQVILDAASERVRHQNLLLLLAGESITESWRDHMLDRLGKTAHPEIVCLLYSPTSTSGPIGCETPTSIAIRRQAQKNPALAKILFGEQPDQSTFVQYDPEMHYIENYANNSLLITADADAPLVRYQSTDPGRVWTPETLKDMLGSHGDLIDRAASPPAFLSIVTSSATHLKPTRSHEHTDGTVIVTEKTMTSSRTTEIAYRIPGSTDQPWQLSWLPRRALTREQALAGMYLAEALHRHPPDNARAEQAAKTLGISVVDASEALRQRFRTQPSRCLPADSVDDVCR